MANITEMAGTEEHPTASGVRVNRGWTFERGAIVGLSRLADQEGEGRVTMYDRDGMVPTALVGHAGSGKTNAARLLARAAGSYGANVLHVDPRGHGDGPRARVNLVGRAASLRAPELVDAIVCARAGFARRSGARVLRTTGPLGAWMVLHEEFCAVADDVAVAGAWGEAAGKMGSLAMWPVVTNPSLLDRAWGERVTRAGFTKQLVAFELRAPHEREMSGLSARVLNRRWHDDGPVRGRAVQGRPGARHCSRVRWDLAPGDQALDALGNQRDLHEIDVQAIESVLGPAVDGRWVVGGPDGTHAFPPVAIDLSPLEKEVLTAVREGTSCVRAIEDVVAPQARFDVRVAMARLVQAGLVAMPKPGRFVAVPQNEQ